MILLTLVRRQLLPYVINGDVLGPMNLAVDLLNMAQDGLDSDFWKELPSLDSLLPGAGAETA